MQTGSGMAFIGSNADWQVRVRRLDAIRTELTRVAGPGLLIKSCPRDRGPHAVRIWEPGNVAQWFRRYYALRVLQRLRAAPSASGDRAKDMQALLRVIAVAEILTG